MDSERWLLEKLKVAKEEYFRLAAAFEALTDKSRSCTTMAGSPEALEAIAQARRQMDAALEKYRRSLDCYAAAVLRSQTPDRTMVDCE